ncbi:hypothetical protein HYE68_007614 [Fusarium pseudograminearum]|nr:hypothetical protein HYE68_007614 [Fusarium pseudograminearum]
MTLSKSDPNSIFKGLHSQSPKDYKSDDVDGDVGDLRTLFDEHPIPVISPKTVSLISFKTHNELEQASIVVDAFNVALANNDAIALQTCFFPAQGYWKDSLALTYHLRTFRGPEVIARSLLKTKEARQCKSAWKLQGAVFVPATPVLDEFQGDHLLSKDELADHLRRFVSRFNLNIITSAKIQSTAYNKLSKKWKIKVETPTKIITVTAKHVVQATGIGSQKPHVPIIANAHDYKGIAIHSSDYRNGQRLVNQGVKSVLIVGSANTAFDILEDCHAAGLQVTMVVRSPTYVVPLEYIKNKRSLGAYDFGVAAADRMFLTLPTEISGQLARNLFRMLASQEPDRYAALQKAGFPVLDSAEPRQALHSNLVERAGGHYVDIGGTELLAQGRAGVKAGVEPVAFTGTGLRFSDGSIADAEAVIWCTGYSDHDVRNMAVEILGGDEGVHDDNTLGPQEIAARVDATWGVDSEGEIRGMWKRHPRLENYWIMGGWIHAAAQMVFACFGTANQGST